MTLAETIIYLRTTNNMSQGDLAERLSVSRQSVSKWETGASTPDLDKLVMMSDLFGITLDELVKNNSTPNHLESSSTQEASQPQIIYVQTAAPTPQISDKQKLCAYLLLSTGIFCCILGLITPLGIAFMVLGFYVILCSILCFFIKRHAGLIISWMTWIIGFLFTLFMRPYGILSIFFGYINTAGGLFCLAVLLAFFPLVVMTFIRLRQRS